MTTYYIFADESGTMPINDSDKPFVAATIAFQRRPPRAINGSNNDDRLIAILKDLDAKPFATIVRPFRGYGEILKERFSKMTTMARAKCLLDSKKIQYLDKNGINLRNEVWQQAMLQSVAHTSLELCFGYESIESIKFIFDEKP